MAWYRCVGGGKNQIAFLIDKTYNYQDASPVNYTYILDGVIYQNITLVNNQKTYMEPKKSGPNTLKIYITREQGGTEIEVAAADYELTTTGSSAGNYTYLLEYSDPNYIYSIRFEFIGIYRVSGTLSGYVLRAV